MHNLTTDIQGKNALNLLAAADRLQCLSVKALWALRC